MEFKWLFFQCILRDGVFCFSDLSFFNLLAAWTAFFDSIFFVFFALCAALGLVAAAIASRSSVLMRTVGIGIINDINIVNNKTQFNSPLRMRNSELARSSASASSSRKKCDARTGCAAA